MLASGAGGEGAWPSGGAAVRAGADEHATPIIPTRIKLAPRKTRRIASPLSASGQRTDASPYLSVYRRFEKSLVGGGGVPDLDRNPGAARLVSIDATGQPGRAGHEPRRP